MSVVAWIVNYQLMLRIVGATLVVALLGSHRLNASCCLGAHKQLSWRSRGL